MVSSPSDLGQEHARLGAALFPATAEVEGMKWSIASNFVGDESGDSPPPFPFYFITTVYFSDFTPAWPIATSWPYAIRGLRGSMSLSQSAFAEICQLGKATVERWESGRAVPFRGDALQLLTLVRPHLVGDIQAGQALNLAAAAVLPKLTRPTAEYAGSMMRECLKVGKHDHRDLIHALLTALTTARILVPTDRSADSLEDTYLPLVGRLHHDDLPVWAAELVDVAASVSEADRALLMRLARRLREPGGSDSARLG